MIKELTIRLPASTRTILRQLEDLLPQIEDGLAQGYSHAVIHAALAELGIKIGLSYYHRALHKLRKEKREGRVPRGSVSQSEIAPVRSPLLGDMRQPSVCQHETTRASDISDAITPKGECQIVDIRTERPQSQPFRWKGQEFLTKDWTNF